MAKAARVVAGSIGWSKVTTTGAARAASSPRSGVTLPRWAAAARASAWGAGQPSADSPVVAVQAPAPAPAPAPRQSGHRWRCGRRGGLGRAGAKDDQDEYSQQVQEMTCAHWCLHLCARQRIERVSESANQRISESANRESANRETAISMRTPHQVKPFSGTGIQAGESHRKDLTFPHTSLSSDAPSPHHSTHTVTGSLSIGVPSGDVATATKRMSPRRQRPPDNIIRRVNNGKRCPVRQQRDRPGRIAHPSPRQYRDRRLLRARRQARVTRVDPVGIGAGEAERSKGESRSRGEFTCPLASGPTPPRANGGASACVPASPRPRVSWRGPHLCQLRHVILPRPRGVLRRELPDRLRLDILRRCGRVGRPSGASIHRDLHVRAVHLGRLRAGDKPFVAPLRTWDGQR